MSFLKGFEAIFLEGEQPAQAPPEIVAERIKAPDLGEHASAFVIVCRTCAADRSRTYVIQHQQANVQSLIMGSGSDDETAMEQAIAYAFKQEQRVETALKQTKND